MVQAAKKQLGEGTRCSVLLRYLRPSWLVAEAFPNATVQQQLDVLVAVRIAKTTRAGRSYWSVFFTSATVPGIKLSASRQFTVVREEGYADGI